MKTYMPHFNRLSRRFLSPDSWRERSPSQLWLPSDLVPEHGARVRFLMGTNVNTPKLQVPTPEFGHGQGLDLVLGHYMVLGALEFPVSEHNTIFFGAQAPVLGQQMWTQPITHRNLELIIVKQFTPWIMRM